MFHSIPLYIILHTIHYTLYRTLHFTSLSIILNTIHYTLVITSGCFRWFKMDSLIATSCPRATARMKLIGQSLKNYGILHDRATIYLSLWTICRAGRVFVNSDESGDKANKHFLSWFGPKGCNIYNLNSQRQTLAHQEMLNDISNES